MADNAESTIVGESILITGQLHGDEDLTILGRVEGSINLSKTLVIAESGVVKAEITVRDAIVSGVVVGNITASDSVQVTESGRLVGDIKAQRVIIVPGARVRGAIDMGDLETTRLSQPLPARASSGSLTKSTSGARSTPAALPARRPLPPPTKAATPATRNDIVRRPATAAATPPSRTVAAPVAAKKIKKKVVVKKKG